MRLVESRTTLIITYIVLGVGAFIALFPTALLVLTSRALGPTLTSAKRC